jgi:hypothetical protein
MGIPTLPYPEEAPDFNQNITVDQLFQKFFANYFIPESSGSFWRAVTIVIDQSLPYPAGMSSEIKTLRIKPEYANPGVLAHEFSHLSWAQLSEAQKAYFPQDYVVVMQTDELLRTLYFQKSYMNASIVEAHAEIFRYLGNKMPEALKKYYPYLIVQPAA